MSFKLIAIRPMQGTSQRFLKNLVAGQIYSLYNDYKFYNNNDDEIISESEEVKKISYYNTVPDNLYTITNNPKNVSVNISAIAGRNGSGKSSIVDLLIIAMYYVTNKLGLVNVDSKINKNISYKHESEMIKYYSDIEEIENGLSAEIYFTKSSNITCLVIKDNTCFTVSYVHDGENNYCKKKKNQIKSEKALNRLFFSIIINYSLYAFNTNINGMWLNPIFNKNDSYQMPIVINPYRLEGDIDINNETYLTESRLLANILSIPSYRDINSKSEISSVEISFEKRKNYKLFPDDTRQYSEEFINNFRAVIVEPLYLKYFEGAYAYPEINSSLKEHTEIYLIHKLIKIPEKYQIYKDFDMRISNKGKKADNYKINKNNASEYIKALLKDKSHITLKVRQTLNFLRENIYNIPEEESLSGTFDLTEVADKLNDLQKIKGYTTVIDYLPPSFFLCKIKFKDGSYFDDLSSGEKQKIFILNSVIYHLRNLDSVRRNYFAKDSQKLRSYGSINIVFDEIELYYHPKLQQGTIKDLIRLIYSAKLKYLAQINIIFLTHSPFILSDIPKQNTLLLELNEENKAVPSKDSNQSFGANIAELLSSNFFMAGSLVGDLARDKIVDLIRRIKARENTQEDLKLVNVIGDSFIRISIENLLEEHD